VVNLVVDGAPNKGDALAAERDRLGCNWVLYVGDDEWSGRPLSFRGSFPLCCRCRFLRRKSFVVGVEKCRPNIVLIRSRV